MPSSKKREKIVEVKSSAKTPRKGKTMKNEKKDMTVKVGAASTAMRYVAPPVATALSSGQTSFATITNRRRDRTGLEIITVKFHQLLAGGIARNNGSQVLSNSSGLPIPGIPINPYFIGGLLSQVCRPYKQYRFVKLKFEYAPGASTTETANLALAYQPYDSATIATIDESLGGPFGQLYRSLVSSATAAAGPIWGPLVALVGDEIGKRSGPLGEAALKWWSNISSSAGEDANTAQSVFTVLQNAQAVSQFTNDLNSYLIGLGLTPPDAPPVSADFRSDDLEKFAQKLGKDVLDSSARSAIQGVMFAATNGPYTGFVNGSGTAACGDFYITGEVELSDVSENGASDLEAQHYGKKGDNLDDLDTDMFHMKYTSADRATYLVDQLRLIAPISVSSRPPPLPQIHSSHGSLQELRAALGTDSRSLYVQDSEVLKDNRSRACGFRVSLNYKDTLTSTGTGKNLFEAADNAASSFILKNGKGPFNLSSHILGPDVRVQDRTDNHLSDSDWSIITLDDTINTAREQLNRMISVRGDDVELISTQSVRTAVIGLEGLYPHIKTSEERRLAIQLVSTLFTKFGEEAPENYRSPQGIAILKLLEKYSDIQLQAPKNYFDVGMGQRGKFSEIIRKLLPSS